MYDFSSNFSRAFENLSKEMIDEIYITESTDCGCFKSAKEFVETYNKALAAVGEFEKNSKDYAENEKECKFVLEFFKGMFSYKDEKLGSRMYQYLDLNLEEEDFIGKIVLSGISEFLTSEFIGAVDFKEFWSKIEECMADVGAAHIIDEYDDIDESNVWFYIGFENDTLIVVEKTTRNIELLSQETAA